MRAEENHDPQKRGHYQVSLDDNIFLYLGMFPFITAEELSHLCGRNVVSLRKRVRQFVELNMIGRDSSPKQRQEFFEEITCSHCGKLNKIAREDGKIRPNPFLHYLLPRGGEKAASLLMNPIVFKTKAQSRLDHDRVITLIHLSLDRVFGKKLTDWRQQKDDLKLTVQLDGERINFYPDGYGELPDLPLYIEYANSEPSSKDGVNDIVEKVRRYNEIMKHEPGKVLFVFRERSMVENFVNRLADGFPYRWIYATDIESIKHNPSGRIFWTPKDFDERAHALIDDATSTNKETDHENVHASR